MPLHSWKLPYLLIGLALGYAILLQYDDSPSDLFFLFALSIALFAALWIQEKERVLLVIAIIGISLNIDRSYALNEDFLLSRWGYMISTTSIALVALYSLGFFKFCFDQERRTRFTSFPTFHFIVMGYVVSMILSFMNAYDKQISSFELFYQIQCVLL
ncbi:MAG: hypothetical protein ETSY1_18740 [Candidatus Entotheonella factor]|uniref:Uncharacterized protein n=1 Tax=Entotheonella factor TaxID=1429438 RepID=W4LKJ2_ENTF1|nr:MAG: hypothetical protein ETSY1_18740 [Candidatus Entotheonella factor]